MVRVALWLTFTWIPSCAFARPGSPLDGVAKELQRLGAHWSCNAAGEITSVDLSNAWLTDVDLETLARLNQLVQLDLSYTKITDLGMEHLASLRQVKVLNLRY